MWGWFWVLRLKESLRVTIPTLGNGPCMAYLLSWDGIGERIDSFPKIPKICILQHGFYGLASTGFSH